MWHLEWSVTNTLAKVSQSAQKHYCLFQFFTLTSPPPRLGHLKCPDKSACSTSGLEQPKTYESIFSWPPASQGLVIFFLFPGRSGFLGHSDLAWSWIGLGQGCRQWASAPYAARLVFNYLIPLITFPDSLLYNDHLYETVMILTIWTRPGSKVITL